MSALMSDVLEGRVTPGVCNAATNAGGKLLKVVEMNHKYGVIGEDKTRILSLTGADPSQFSDDAKKKRIALLENELSSLKN